MNKCPACLEEKKFKQRKNESVDLESEFMGICCQTEYFCNFCNCSIVCTTKNNKECLISIESTVLDIRIYVGADIDYGARRPGYVISLHGEQYNIDNYVDEKITFEQAIDIFKKYYFKVNNLKAFL